MDGVNGTVVGPGDSGSHLGKRKRSSSPAKKVLVNGDGDHSIQQGLEYALNHASKYVSLNHAAVSR